MAFSREMCQIQEWMFMHADHQPALTRERDRSLFSLGEGGQHINVLSPEVIL